MGVETNGHWKTARDRIHEKDRRLYLYKLATNYHAVPIGFYESEDGRSWPIYNEKEKEQMSEDNNKFYRSVTPDERTYMQMALVNEGNDIAEAIISPPIRVTPAEKNNSLAQSILAAIEAKEKHE